MDNKKIKIGVVGAFQRGKSTLVNCLLDGKVARTGGMGVSTTSVTTCYTYGEFQSVSYYSGGRLVRQSSIDDFVKEENTSKGIDEIVVTLWKPILKNVDIVDTPGFDANEKDTKMASDALKDLDFVIFLVINKALGEPEQKVLQQILDRKLPFTVIMNCKCPPEIPLSPDPEAEPNKAITKTIESQIKNSGALPLRINNTDVWMCNLRWFWYACGGYLKDNSDQITITNMQIEQHFKVLLKQQIDNKVIADKSKFIAFRNLLLDSDWSNTPLHFIRWNSLLSQTFNDWENKLKKITNKL